MSGESGDLDIIPSTQDDALSVDHIDQYGSHLSRGAQQFDYFREGVWGREEQPSPRINPLSTASSPSSPPTTSPPKEDGGVDHADVGMASQPEVLSSHVDDIRVPVEHTPPGPGSNGAKDVEADVVLEVGSHAHGASAPIDIVNLSDIESDDEKHLIGDSLDESNHDDEGVDQGISVPTPPMATIAPLVDSSQSPTVLPMTGESAMQQLQNLAKPVEGDTFRNAAGKALHPDAIVSKAESGWWAKRELKKKLKVEQKAVAELELMHLKEQNFILMKQLAMQGNVPSVVSLSAVPPVELNDVGAGNIMAGLVTIDGGTTSNMPPPERGPMLSLILNTLADSAKVGGGVLRVEDRSAPSILVIESQEDSLQFRFEVEMEDVKQS